MPRNAATTPDAVVAPPNLTRFPLQPSGLSAIHLRALRAHCATLLGDVCCEPDEGALAGRTAYLTSKHWSDNPAFMIERRHGRFWLWDARQNPEGVMIEDSADLEDILTVLTAEVGIKPIVA